MSRKLLVLSLAAAALLACAAPARATTVAECPTTCVSPYSKAKASPECIRMCQACINATTSHCTSYFLPYFYGGKYSKHFACWENCPMPVWAWAMIGVAIACACLMICCAIYCCAVRRQQNRAVAMEMYQHQLSETHPQMNARPSKSNHPGFSSKAQAPAPAAPAPAPAPALAPAPAAPKISFTRPLSGMAKATFARAGFAMPSRSSRAPAYAPLDQAEMDNPYSAGRR